nr:hypothetical protein Muribac2_050 [uncultured Muribaculaceae bacterium]
MNKIFTTIAASVLAVSGAAAKDAPSSQLPEGAVSDVAVERSESSLLVSMKVHPEVFAKKWNREVWLRPVIVSGNDSLWLEPVVVAGRTRYYQDLRADGDSPEYVLLRSGDKETYSYYANVPYESWMEKGELEMVSEIDGCCGDGLAEPSGNDLMAFDFRNKEIVPVFAYVKPMGEIEKLRNVEGKAYIDFPVNKTVIYPDYRSNPKELAEIKRTIDEVSNDKDVNITSLTIKGFASPEGPYANNERLAKGRTQALVKYVGDLYSFPKSVLHSEWEAEDWNGLAERLLNSKIDNKDAILAIVNDGNMAPDARDAELKKRFPEQYAYMLAEIYPSLRHSDYTVNYVIRNFTDVNEIAEVMKTAPQKLSLEELFIYAQSLDKNSPEFREVMEVAVRMYPDDPIANLNAATTALDHGEYDLARTYLQKAGNSAEALYTAGVLEAKVGNYFKAAQLLQKASQAGVKDADRLISEMKDWGWIE